MISDRNACPPAWRVPRCRTGWRRPGRPCGCAPTAGRAAHRRVHGTPRWRPPVARVRSGRRGRRVVGLAYQLTDDILGIWGDPDRMGKSAGADLAVRKRSLPVVAALTSGTTVGRLLRSRQRRRSAQPCPAAGRAGGRAWAPEQAAGQLRLASGLLASVSTSRPGRSCAPWPERPLAAIADKCPDRTAARRGRALGPPGASTSASVACTDKPPRGPQHQPTGYAHSTAEAPSAHG